MNNNRKQPVKPWPTWLKVLVSAFGISLFGGVGVHFNFFPINFHVVEEKEDSELLEKAEKTADRAEALVERMEKR